MAASRLLRSPKIDPKSTAQLQKNWTSPQRDSRSLYHGGPRRALQMRTQLSLVILCCLRMFQGKYPSVNICVCMCRRPCQIIPARP